MKLSFLLFRASYNINLAVYKTFFITLFIILVISTFSAFSIYYTGLSKDEKTHFTKIDLNFRNAPRVELPSTINTKKRNTNCTHWDCFNIYKCGHTGHDRITVYVYPFKKYFSQDGVPAVSSISKEYFELIKTVVDSNYYTVNPHEACIFLTTIDTLNQERININVTSTALHTLPYWNNGENHIIFNMLPGSPPDMSTVIDLDIGNAIVAGAGFDTYSFRTNFDISLPLYSPLAKLAEINNISRKRNWYITSSQLGIDPYYLDELQKLAYQQETLFLMLDACHNHNYTSRCEINSGKLYSYPEILKHSTFCLVFRGERMAQFTLLEAMAANCIPVVVMNSVVMPFNSVIDWKRAAVFIMEDYLNTLVKVLNKISEKRIIEMRQNIKFLYKAYFSSMEKITLTTLDILQDRVYPHWCKMYDDWNIPHSKRNKNPLFMPHTAPKSHGFTAVILTYDRVESLFTLIRRLSKVPSLMKILVVWNNQKKYPPPFSEFPKVQKPVKVIRTRANKLSNRFIPYREIETEAILHIDDDIVMLTADELEFGYEVWREFPDRIVGFPSRTHIWNNVTGTWKYESEWTNEISMVLTGAAFLHKYWSYMYTKKLTSEIRDWVDENMNCEDIAMNFLVANVTNQPPIKVTPRKKFKCPECTNNEMLSADIGHMVERSQCVDRFAKIFGRMPLQSVEFRADPVLFKDPFPEKLKRFNDIGSL
ncbi:exostosin-2 [Coccinella septempunctata]|uniref:exostosin-2 n=1 Tax=Coccinella septempunctata TaxID=41139 RepID=UPI001D083F9B|nr:exostosin-2 [Coccinella septempunctata]